LDQPNQYLHVNQEMQVRLRWIIIPSVYPRAIVLKSICSELS